MRQRLLYINDYNCTDKHRDGYPDQHLWGADALGKEYDVTCAHVPKNIIKKRFKGSRYINNFWKSLVMFIRYHSVDIVYSACGDLTDAFAMANILHISKIRLFKIQHQGHSRILFPKGYSRIIFISPIIQGYYPKLVNSCLINWGGQQSFADKNGRNSEIKYDFISAGKTGRDYNCMCKSVEQIDAKALIITSKVDFHYDKSKVIVIGGNDRHKNSLNDIDTYHYYGLSKFICIPAKLKIGKDKKNLNGLTSFVDAVVMHRPVLISDNTNMGIDVESLGIGFIYKAGNVNDMCNKMKQMLSMSDNAYLEMCHNMKLYSLTHNYTIFCKELLNIIS